MNIHKAFQPKFLATSGIHNNRAFSVFRRRLMPSWLVALSASLITLSAQAQYSPPASGLVSWWQGEGNANDSVDSNNGITLNGAGYGVGVFGSAFSFDGINDHVRVSSSANLQITSSLTVGAWVYRLSVGGYQEVISKWDASTVNQRSYTLSMQPDGRAGFAVSPDGSHTAARPVYTAPALPLNTWTHLAGTYDGSNIRIYVNGALGGQSAYSGGVFSGSDDLAIGGAVGGVSVNSGISFFRGMIDEAVIYNRALSGSEITTLATVPEPSSMGIFLLGFVSLFLKGRIRQGSC